MNDTSEPLTDNGALNAIVQQLVQIMLAVDGDYDSVQGTATFNSCTSIAPFTQAAVDNCVAQVVVNGGATVLNVTEGGVLVAVVPAYTSQRLPLNAGGALSIAPASGSGSVAVASYIKAFPPTPLVSLVPANIVAAPLAPKGTTVTTSGSTTGNNKSVEFIFSSDFVGTVAGAPFTGAVDAAQQFKAPQGYLLASFAYTITAGSIRLIQF